jgi:hypothetical protein
MPTSDMTILVGSAGLTIGGSAAFTSAAFFIYFFCHFSSLMQHWNHFDSFVSRLKQHQNI